MPLRPPMCSHLRFSTCVTLAYSDPAPIQSRVRPYDDQLLTIGRDEEVEGESCCGDGVGARTVRVDSILYVVLAAVRVVPDIILHAHTVEADRHDVCPCAVSIENMISGDGEERLPCRHPKGWREQRGDTAE